MEPIGGDENEPLRQMLKEMLLPNPTDRPTIGDVVHRLGRAFDTVTRYSMTEERPVSRVEMDTYIWHPEVHRRLGEKMYFFYLDNLALDSWEKLQKRLNEKEIFSFSIHRVIGETDFILRGWFSEQSITHVRTIVGDFGEGVVKGSESKGFMAVDVLPTPPPNALWAKKEYSPFKEWLKHAIEPWPKQDQYPKLQKLGVAVGKIESSDTHIRLFLRIDVTKAGEVQHAITYADNFEKFFHEQFRERRIVGIFFVWRISNHTTFIVEFRLKAFKEYKHLVSDFAKMTSEKNLNRAGPSQFHTTSLLELDARGIVESDDGEITALLRAPAPARR